MPKYQFEAMDSTGHEIRDFIEAPSQEEAQKTIRDMGYFVTKLSESEKPIDQENLNSMRIQKKHEKQNCPEVFCHIDWFVYRFIDSCIATLWVCECWSNHIL
jgi:type II secretory pathway component PulF